jgi:hypothetical protein
MINRAIAIMLLLASVAGASQYYALHHARRGRVAAWTPADLPGLALWLDASDASTLWADTNATAAATNNGLVARWDDKSGNGYHAEAALSSARPRFTENAQNGNGALQGVSTSTRMDMPAASRSALRNKTHAYLFTVAYNDGATSAFAESIAFTTSGGGGTGRLTSYARDAGSGVVAGSLARRLNGDGSANISTNITASYRIVNVFGDFAGGFVRLSLNAHPYSSLALASGAGSTSDTDSDSVYGVRLLGTNYELAEVLAINTELSTSDRQKLEGYLAHKWGLAGNLPADHPWKNQAPTK